jgi:hypothetical protein
MDPQIVQNALRAVLGDAYEERSRVTINDPRPDAPVRKDAVGSDMHVMTSISTPRSKRAVRVPGGNGKLKPMVSVVDNSVGSVDKAMDPQTKSKVGEGLTTAGAVGGALSLPGLAGHTGTKLQQAGVLKPKAALPPMAAGMNADPEVAHIGTGVSRKISHVLKPMADAAHKLPGMKVEGEGLRNPKVGAGLAVGAAGLEIAGLAGDVMGRKAFKEQRQVGTPGNIAGVSKSDAGKRRQGAAALGAGTVAGSLGAVMGGVPGAKEPDTLRPWSLKSAPHLSRAGIFGYRSNAHEHATASIKAEPRVTAYEKGNMAGKVEAETKIMRGMRRARKGSYALTALGGATAVAGAHRFHEGNKKVSKARRSDSRTNLSSAEVGAGAALAGGGHLIPKALDHYARHFDQSAKTHLRSAEAIAPNLGGPRMKPARMNADGHEVRPAKVDRKPEVENYKILPSKADPQQVHPARQEQKGRLKGVPREGRFQAGLHRGKAANEAHFADVFAENAEHFRRLRAPGLALAGAGAMGLAVSHQDRGPVKKSAEDVVTFSKVDDDKQQVFGWVSISKKDGVEVLDLQGDYVPIEEIEKSAYDYMLKSRKGGNQHARIYSELGDQPKHVADVIESVVFTPEKIEKMGLPGDHTQGWWMGMQIFDDETWRQVKSGERAGFSIHGQGKREVVEKAHDEIDRKEQAKIIGLGAAGATAAGSGAAAATVPWLQQNHPARAAKVGIKSAQQAEKLSGHLKLVAAGVAAPAGIYGGLHAIHSAVHRPPKKTDPKRTMADIVVGKAWSPVVEHNSLEEDRQRRTAGYQRAATATAAGGAAVGAGGLAVRHVSLRGAAESKASADRVRVPTSADLERNLKRGANYRRARNIPEGGKKAALSMRTTNLNHSAAVKTATDIKAGHEAAAGKLVARAGNAGKVARVGGLVALGAGAAAGAIHHERKNSWKPYGQ